MSWALVVAAGEKVYEWNKSNQDKFDEQDARLAPLFSQDMTPARQLPVIGAYWMWEDGAYWYIAHDDLTLGMVASTYLPVDHAADPVWNRRIGELWEMQPPEFKFAMEGYGREHDPVKVQSSTYPDGSHLYWGVLPNGTPILMPQESVDIALAAGANLPGPQGHDQPPPMPAGGGVDVQKMGDAPPTDAPSARLRDDLTFAGSPHQGPSTLAAGVAVVGALGAAYAFVRFVVAPLIAR